LVVAGYRVKYSLVMMTFHSTRYSSSSSSNRVPKVGENWKKVGFCVVREGSGKSVIFEKSGK